MKKKIIGILGGMGPEASCHLYKNIIHHYQGKYDAQQDIDFPHIIINSIGLEGFSEKGVEDEESVQQGLLTGIQQLEAAGVDIIFMACNTVHIYYEFLQNNTSVKIVNLVSSTVQKIHQSNITSVLILGSHTTHDCQLYDTYLEEYNISFQKVTEREQKNIDTIIKKVMSNTLSGDDSQWIENITKKYNTQGIIIACTELPLIFETLELKNTFDTLGIIVELIEEFDKKKG